MHFLPASPPRVYLDHTFKYAIDHPQTSRFVREWTGEIASRKVPGGYVLEMRLSFRMKAIEPSLFTLSISSACAPRRGLSADFDLPADTVFGGKKSLRQPRMLTRARMDESS
ncbi:MAG: hypothetical protein M1608_01195, partial [Candidatus Omnitrophica bacterium]|nr:hypothetical protein [Candidatus Omnitrophota bacterium]